MELTTNFLSGASNHITGAHSIAVGPGCGVFGCGEVALWMPTAEGNVLRYLFKPNGAVWVGYDPRKADISYMRLSNPGMVAWVNFEMRTHINKLWPESPIMSGEQWFETFTDGTKVNMDPYTDEVRELVAWAKMQITSSSSPS